MSEGKSISPAAREMDRLSSLPEPLLFKILERIGFEEAVNSATLSKQWRFLWRNVAFPFRNRSENLKERQRFVARVHAALAARREPALDRLLVLFKFDESFASDVDSWIDFAAKNKLKDLSLYLDLVGEAEPYTLPKVIYSISSLTRLHLENCLALIPEAAAEWRRLKSLSLEFVQLPQEAVDAIVSGSPVLEILDLVGCYGFRRLEIGGRCFRRLSVKFCGDVDEGALEISAPRARDLHLMVQCNFGLREKVRVRNAPFLERASIHFYEEHLLSIHASVMRDAIELLEDLRHVKDLHLCGSSNKVLSFMATNGWQLPQLKVESLFIQTASYMGSIYGVVAVLESSPYLEKLSINGSNQPKKGSMEWGAITRDDLNCDLLHLKTVEFVDFFNSKNRREPTLTLAHILLKRAPVLEKMAIRGVFSTADTYAVKKALLKYPKASSKASIISSSFRAYLQI